ncbi:tyrosine-type recombinase/integrase [Marinobacter daepoensis]|uniref:tyrosine-type recombinase/integrase n=1 Tax=Marinobacter daepoensis TaxID=262077 RepID=UPI00041F8EBB|nr:site-specific integrase [Marinobacter daepoensis]
MRSKNSSQLYQPVRELTLFSHLALGRIATKDGSNMPHIVWPDGTPCMLANLYMLNLRERPGRGEKQGLSRRGSKGGTMGEYAAKLSQLVRFCHTNGWDLIQLTDDRFTLFINALRSERSSQNPEARKKTETTLTAVGRVCLDFLEYVGAFYGDSSFVSEQGTIRATKKDFSIPSRNRGKDIKRSYWHHHSFSSGERIKKRNPIPAENIEKLRKAVDKAGGSRFLQSRRHCVLSILEQVGPRRGEVVELRVSEIMKASGMEHPMLKILNLKQGEDSYRSVPVTHMLLAQLKKHIRLFRNKVIKSKLGKVNDHDFFLVSETTGKPVGADLITNEISKLRSIAGIEEQACAHMFRHSFVTNLFVLLIERHEFENTNDFRKALLGSEKFRMEVMQWTGHQDPSSLDHYIDFAFAKVSNYAHTVSSVHLIRAQEIFDKMLLELSQKLQNGTITVDQHYVELQELISLRNKDFETAQARDD